MKRQKRQFSPSLLSDSMVAKIQDNLEDHKYQCSELIRFLLNTDRILPTKGRKKDDFLLVDLTVTISDDQDYRPKYTLGISGVDVKKYGDIIKYSFDCMFPSNIQWEVEQWS